MNSALFLHGWAQSRRIWFEQQARFPDATFMNLPGHGGSDDAESWLESIVAALPEKPVHLVGWSLGGMLAIEIAAAYPERLASLTLVATTPKFRAVDEWAHGSSEAVFEGFRAAIESGSPKALNRFFMLMLHGDGLDRSAYNQLAKAGVDREQRPSDAALRHGLDLLEQLDLREPASTITLPTLIMHGSDDAIVPVDAGHWLADNIADASMVRFDACGHAPFMTQAEYFNDTLEDWWQQL